MQRCMQYSAEVLRNKGLGGEVTAELLINQLVEHGREKLFILLDEYVVTEGGKRLARPSHDAMMAEVEILKGCLRQLQHLQNSQKIEGEEGGESCDRVCVDATQQRDELFACCEGGRILLDILRLTEQ